MIKCCKPSTSLQRISWKWKRIFLHVSEGRPCHSKSIQKEKNWSQFHKVRMSELPKLWRDLCSKHKVLPNLSPLVCQYVNQRLYASIIKSLLCQSRVLQVPLKSQNLQQMKSIILYAARYVPFKLLKSYEKGSSNMAVLAVECVSAMALWLSMMRRAV